MFEAPRKKQRCSKGALSTPPFLTLPTVLLSECLGFLPFSATALLMMTHRHFRVAAKATQLRHPAPGSLWLREPLRLDEYILPKELLDLGIECITHLSAYDLLQLLSSPSIPNLRTLRLSLQERKDSDPPLVHLLSHDKTFRKHLQLLDVCHTHLFIDRELELSCEHLVLRAKSHLYVHGARMPKTHEVTLVGMDSISSFRPESFPNLRTLRIIVGDKSNKYPQVVVDRERRFGAFKQGVFIIRNCHPMMVLPPAITHFWNDYTPRFRPGAPNYHFRIVEFLSLARYPNFQLGVLSPVVRLERRSKPNLAGWPVFDVTWSRFIPVDDDLGEVFKTVREDLRRFKVDLVWNDHASERVINAWPWARFD